MGLRRAAGNRTTVGHYGLDDAEAALRAGREDATAVKVMVMPAGTPADV